MLAGMATMLGMIIARPCATPLKDSFVLDAAGAFAVEVGDLGIIIRRSKHGEPTCTSSAGAGAWHAQSVKVARKSRSRIGNHVGWLRRAQDK